MRYSAPWNSRQKTQKNGANSARKKMPVKSELLRDPDSLVGANGLYHERVIRAELNAPARI
jgi:hypothetical protein